MWLLVMRPQAVGSFLMLTLTEPFIILIRLQKNFVNSKAQGCSAFAVLVELVNSTVKLFRLMGTYLLPAFP